jgi:manganese transport protein
MGEFVNASWLQSLAWTTSIAIMGLNVWLLVQTALGHN